MKKSIKKDKKNSSKLGVALYVFITASFILPIVYLIFRLMSGAEAENSMGIHSKADYALMIVQCLLGLIVVNVPSVLTKHFKFAIPMPLYVMYIIFLYCAIFLGEVRSFFYIVPHWDVILHAFSGLMSGYLGFMAITLLNKNDRIYLRLSPQFMAIFAFCFAITLGVLWEIYEFVFDGILGLNMQKFMLSNGTVLAGHAALRDTMKDIIVDSASAFIASVTGYFMVKNEKYWMFTSAREEQDAVLVRSVSTSSIRKRFSRSEVLTVPNAMSLLRLLLIPLIGWLYVKKRMYTAALIMFAFSMLTDFLDGIVARKFDMISDLGKFLDPLADKCTHAAMFVMLALRYPSMWALFGVFAVKELLMLVMGAVVFYKTDTVNSAKWYGKLCTNIIDAGIIALLLFSNMHEDVAKAIISVCIGAVLFSFLLYMRFYMKLLAGREKIKDADETVGEHENRKAS